jgi:hypothetical protein
MNHRADFSWWRMRILQACIFFREPSESLDAVLQWGYSREEMEAKDTPTDTQEPVYWLI